MAKQTKGSKGNKKAKSTKKQIVEVHIYIHNNTFQPCFPPTLPTLPSFPPLTPISNTNPYIESN